MTDDKRRWIPLVEEAQGGGFVLSHDLRKLAGPVWRSDSYELKKFVSQVVSHFEDQFEHLLEEPVSSNEPLVFDVTSWYCEDFALRFRKEFLPVSPGWFKRLIRARLLTLRLPADLVVEAKQAYLSAYNPQKLAEGISVLLRQRSVDIETAPQIAATVHEVKNSPTTWTQLEHLLESLLGEGRITEDEIWDTLYGWAFEKKQG